MSVDNPEVEEVSFEDAMREEKEGTPPGAVAPPQQRPAVSEPPAPIPVPAPAPAVAQTPVPDAGNIDQAPRPKPGAALNSEEQVDPPEKEIEIIAKNDAKKWDIGPDNMRRSYIQREMSVIGKAQWFSLVGETIDKALSGDNRLSLNSLLAPPQITPGSPIAAQFADADTFVHAVGKLLNYSPEFLVKSICIWLDVPDYEWELVEQLMKMSPTEGGLSDDDFEDIVDRFIDQNYPSIERFFRERYPRLRARLQARRTVRQSPSPSPRR